MARSADLLWRRNVDLNISLSLVEWRESVISFQTFSSSLPVAKTPLMNTYILWIYYSSYQSFSGFMPCNSMVLDGSCDGSAMCLTDWRNICWIIWHQNWHTAPAHFGAAVLEKKKTQACAAAIGNEGSFFILEGLFGSVLLNLSSLILLYKGVSDSLDHMNWLHS